MIIYYRYVADKFGIDKEFESGCYQNNTILVLLFANFEQKLLNKL